MFGQIVVEQKQSVVVDVDVDVARTRTWTNDRGPKNVTTLSVVGDVLKGNTFFRRRISYFDKKNKKVLIRQAETTTRTRTWTQVFARER